MVMYTRRGEEGTYRFLERSVLEHPPYSGVVLENPIQLEECPDGFVSRFKSRLHVSLHVGFFVLTVLQDHQAVKVVAGQEEVLLHGSGSR